MERRMMAMAENDGRSKEEVKEEENKAKAVIAAKAGNLPVGLLVIVAVVVAAVLSSHCVYENNSETFVLDHTHLMKRPTFLIVFGVSKSFAKCSKKTQRKERNTVATSLLG